jgi:hypothetical protein
LRPAIHSFLTAEDAEDAEKNAEKTSEELDVSCLILEHATSSAPLHDEDPNG